MQTSIHKLFSMRKQRKLLTFDRQPGFLCDWHICGWFDAGLQHNPAPSLFDKKNSLRWAEDHLAPWGGCAGIKDVPPPAPLPQWERGVEWALAPLTWHPILSLLSLRKDFLAWENPLQDLHPDSWHKLWYALAVVKSPRRMEAELCFSGWDGCRLWINGALSFEEHSYHHVIVDMEKTRFTLEEGLNSFLFQLDRDGVCARIGVPGDPRALEDLRSVAEGEPPSPRAVGTFAPMRRYAQTLKIKCPFKGTTSEDLLKWQKSFGAFYRRCLGEAPAYPPKMPPPALEQEDRLDGYTRRRYALPCEGAGSIPAWVLAPDEAKFNGRTVVIAHGHEDPRRTVGETPLEGPRIASGKLTHNYAECMAQRGFFTVMINERAFGQRRDCFGPMDDPCNAAGLQAQCMGLTLPRLHIADLHLLYDFACTFPEVDRARIGLGGLSGGGTLSYIAGAFDDHFKAVAVFCGMTRYADYAAGKGCGMQVVPGLYPTGDVGEVLALIAPRPLLLAQGRLDSSFNVVRFKSIAEDARKAYRAAGASDRLRVEVMDLAHQFDPDLAAEYYTKWL